jgi:hypothetical protein
MAIQNIIIKDKTVSTFSNLSWLGNWAVGAYNQDDAVAHNGRMWWASTSITTEEPGVDAEWVVIPAGATGPAGAPGAAGTAGVDPDITSLAGLAAVTTTTIILGGSKSIKLFVDSIDELLNCWQLRSSTANTVSGSIQRPDDYATSTNEKVWFRCL